MRLLEGEPEVRALLAHDPFPGAPPRYVRAVVRDYRFTDLATRRRTGAWWSTGPARVAFALASPGLGPPRPGTRTPPR